MLSRGASSPLRLRSDTRAVAATEFALLLPIVVLLYAGAGELSQAAMTSRKVELLSRTIADLASQQPTFAQASSTPAPPNAISQGTLQSMLSASLAVMAPGPLATLAMTVSAVDVGNNPSGVCCKATVRWTYTQSGALRPCSVPLQPADPAQAPSPATISSAVLPQGTNLSSPVSILIADVSYTYQGPFSSQWISIPGFTRTSYMLPRSTGQVILQGPISSAGNQNGTICY